MCTKTWRWETAGCVQGSESRSVCLEGKRRRQRVNGGEITAVRFQRASLNLKRTWSLISVWGEALKNFKQVSYGIRFVF